MKLRIRGDSLRLRLTQGEVGRFAAEGVVEETIRFGSAPDQFLMYRVRRDDSVTSIRAELTHNELTVTLPADIADQWIATERVGMEVHNDIGKGRFLHILIEKDFACLARRHGEDDKDTFPHPSAGESG